MKECTNCQASFKKGALRIIVDDKPYCMRCGGQYYTTRTGTRKK